MPIFKQGLRDQYIQNWNTSLSIMPKLEYYRKLKLQFCYEKYLDVLTNNSLRKTLTRFRLSCHNLEIETGRHQQNTTFSVCVMCDMLYEHEIVFYLCNSLNQLILCV